MPTGFSSSDNDDLSQAEQDIQARIGDLELDFEAMAAVSNIFRVANAARHHFERSVLGSFEMSFTAFTTLWVLWVWGEREARHLAAEAGISKGTLTGVVSTLEKRGLVMRRTHGSDRRLVLISSTEAGNTMMSTIFPLFNGEEARISSALSSAEKQAMAQSLRRILRTLEKSPD